MMTKEEMQEPEMVKMLAAAEVLAEFFDSVLILTTRYEGDGETNTWHVEKGNQFALMGSAQAWLEGELYEEGEE